MVCSLVGEIERGEILAKMTKTKVNREERKITYKEDDIWLDNPQFLPPLFLALSTRRYLERTIIHPFQFHLSHQFSNHISEHRKRTSPSGFVLGLFPVRSDSSLISCHTGFNFPN
jgi:hypothetical protein